jgi:hypothetical protein
MIAIYDRDLHYRLSAQGFENGGIRTQDGQHYITKDGFNLNQGAEGVGPWEKVHVSGQLVVFEVDPTTVFVWAEVL